jgi:hypothetical protein
VLRDFERFGQLQQRMFFGRVFSTADLLLSVTTAQHMLEDVDSGSGPMLHTRGVTYLFLNSVR